MKFKWPLLIPLFVAVLLGFLLHSGVGKDPRDIPSPFIGKPAPGFNLPIFATEQKLDNQSLRGKPYLLNVFASWCFVCRQEHATLAEYAKQTSRLLLVGLNYKDEFKDAQPWLAQFGNPYDVVAVDLDGRTGIDYGVYGAPESFFIDKLGIVRYKHVGEMTPDMLQEWTNKLLTQVRP
jgi:cytochrome c biogenesis protein CcmG, thiol:disulfide interchange protein DsbE